VADRIEIELLIGPDGQVRVETRGLKGTACIAETEALERALGRVEGRTRTSEYHQQPATSQASRSVPSGRRR
jgi:hypothetical protein